MLLLKMMVQLKAKAKELGIDISSATSKGEVRKMLADVIK